jgi:peptidoglycan hydrolase FlgJ
MNIEAAKTAALGATPEPPAKLSKIHEAAQQFEALFAAQILRSAREASASEGQDSTTQTIREVAEEQIALSMAKQGGLGLAQSIVGQLTAINATTNQPSPVPTVKID